MKKWFKKLRPKRTKIEERVNILGEEIDEDKTSRYTSTSLQSSSTSSYLGFIDQDVEEKREDIPPTPIFPEVESQKITTNRADMKEPPTQVTFKERVRNLFSRRSSPKGKSGKITASAFIERLTNLMPRPFRSKVKAGDIDFEGKDMKKVGREEEDLKSTQASQAFPTFQTFPTFPSYPEPSTHRRPADKDMLTKLIHRSLYPQEPEDEGLGRYYRLEDKINTNERQMSLHRLEQSERVFVPPTVTSGPEFNDGIKYIRKGRRSPQKAFIAQSYVRESLLESDVLAKSYLDVLRKFGYQFGNKIADIKYGTVFECFFLEQLHKLSTRKPLVCKKVVIPENILNEKLDFARNRLNPERVALTLARHRNIIPIENIWSNYESFEIVFPVFVLFFMERADGNLSRFFKDRAKVKSIPVQEEEIKIWFKMIVEGLKYLHSIRIAHLKLRPKCILYVWDPNQEYPFVAKIADFQMSFFTSNYRCMNLGDTTQEFIAPEVQQSDDDVVFDPFKADIYSLGKLLDYMKSFVVEGQQNQESPHSSISEELDHLVYWMTDCYPDLRPTFDQIEEQAWLKPK
jgi:hypothetical protein